MSNIVDVFVEVAKNSNLKYEYNPNDNRLQLYKILPYKLNYPYNYGYITNSISPDGQEIDALIMLDEPLSVGTFIKCKIIGGIEYIGEKGIDYKLIVCPANDIDSRFIYINDISNLKQETLNKIRYFFNHYKDNLHIKIKTGKFLNNMEAIELYNKNKINK